MEDRWHYERDGSVQEPVTVDELRKALLAGEIQRENLVWRKGMEEWRELGSVEELQGLLDELPPPLPPGTGSRKLEIPEVPPPPPPLPPPPVPAALPAAEPTGSAPSTTGTHSPQPSEPSDKKAEEPGKKPSTFLQALGRWVDKLFGSAADELGKSLIQRLFQQPAAVITFITVLIGGGVVVVAKVIPDFPAGVAGQVQIDANPWGEVDWIRSSEGTRVDLPSLRTTPLVLSLPVGSYEAQISYPPGSQVRRCSLQVRESQVAACWVDLAPVDAGSYLEKIGW